MNFEMSSVILTWLFELTEKRNPLKLTTTDTPNFKSKDTDDEKRLKIKDLPYKNAYTKPPLLGTGPKRQRGKPPTPRPAPKKKKKRKPLSQIAVYRLVSP